MTEQATAAEDDRLPPLPPPPGPSEGFASWAILELFGHRSLAGYVTEALVAGVAFVRVDVPRRDGTRVTQFYNPKSVYSLTPTTEAVARGAAAEQERYPLQVLQLGATSDAPYDADKDDHRHDTDDDQDDDDDDDDDEEL